MEEKLKNKQVLVLCPNPSVDIYASIDGFSLGTTTRIKSEKRYPGGKGVHVAMALSELGANVTLIGFWGGITGEWVQQEIHRYYPSIKIDGVNTSEWTRSCYTFKSEGEANDSELLGTGPKISATENESFFEIVRKYVPDSDALVLSGSWPLGAPIKGYAQLIKLAKSYHVKSYLDCTGEQLSYALVEQPFLIHLNRHEVMEIAHSQDFDEARSKISVMVNNSVITNGSKGVYHSTNDHEVHSVYKVDKVISTIGSGDCLLAGVVAGHLLSYSAQEIANIGAACGAANCIREELGMIYKTDVLRLLRISTL